MKVRPSFSLTASSNWVRSAQTKGNCEMSLTTPKRTFFAMLLSCLCVVALTYVQHHRVPGKAENAVRLISSSSSLVVVPILVCLAYLKWHRLLRTEMPTWRNGLALSSVVLLACIWGFSAALLLSATLWRHLTESFILNWFATLLDGTLVAGLLALLLRGSPRIYLIASSLLMWACLQSQIYF